jgi:hypothetical protein
MNEAAIEEHNRRVLAALDAIQKDVAEIKRRLPSASSANGAGAREGGDVASDRDLDGSNGDPTIRYDPKEKYWTGRSYAGYRFSETEPDYLDATSKYLDACAYMFAKDQDEKKRKTARYKTLDAARARGWAARLRNGWKPAEAPQQTNGGGTSAAAIIDADGYADDDIPFARPEWRWDRP